MFRPSDSTVNELYFIALSLQGFLYGIYSGIFAMYLLYQVKKDTTTNRHNVVFYSICVLYVLSVALNAVEIAGYKYLLLWEPPGPLPRLSFHIAIIQAILFGCCDFIAQFILIYRCWIVWGCNIHVVFVPSVLAFAYLVIWAVGASSVYISPDHKLSAPYRGYLLTLLGLALSLTVNALATGLIVFRIFKVFRQVRTISRDRILGTTGGNKLRRAILVLIESGMTLFAIQLARLVVTLVGTDAAYKAFIVIAGTHNMLNGITSTIIFVQTSMGLFFRDEMEELANGSLRLVSNQLNPVQDMGCISIIVGQDSSDDDNIDVQQSNNATML